MRQSYAGDVDMMDEDYLIDAYLQVADRDVEKALRYMAKEILRLRKPAPGFERGADQLPGG